jgi:mannose-6-phosphate isomerase-like protein (cupin superfamily)
MDKVNLAQKFASFSEQFQPRIVGELNGQHVKIAKVQGEFVWHHHEDADELFLVVKGALTIQLRDRNVRLGEGELFIVPRGVEHCPLAEKLAGFTEQWQPRIVGELNGQHVKVVKLQGEFVWHHHEQEDELFLVVKGTMTIQLRDRDIHLGEGEFFIVPRGVEHRPVASDEAHVMLFEPASTLNTGNLRNERTYEATPA